MWIYDVNRKCKHCGVMDTVFFAQKQRGNHISINNICQPCKAKERSKYYYTKSKYNMYMMERI